MISISEPKLAGFVPRWAAFPGFSLLFDNPARAYRLDSGLEELACDVADEPSLEFYWRVRTALEAQNLDRLLQTYGFCALPPKSYHVTAYDVANQGDLTRCKSDCRDSLRELLESPIDAARFSHPLLKAATESGVATRPWDIAFRYGSLRISGRVMIVLLAPHGSDDKAKLDAFVETRRTLDGIYASEFGVGGGAKFTPHLSLGYFANAEGGELAKARLRDWDETISAAVGDLPLSFRSASLHGFRTMAEFFRLPKRG
ncbi:MAG: hypothetical protein ACO1SV_01940 [Fimbriimonas sp.]